MKIILVIPRMLLPIDFTSYIEPPVSTATSNESFINPKWKAYKWMMNIIRENDKIVMEGDIYLEMISHSKRHCNC
ncbi:hypothetical protein RCL_jg15663.t1 [Rhizophagus clarus]|uniref:Uncharacterized protein n=1 Tax=Rhizophagus clarus TaxID=94130 RepID=A0A8H3R401_9GLOM|nr:hypothetical protein RCL_jg15663.t1 [Rhizophagus clarus]